MLNLNKLLEIEKAGISIIKKPSAQKKFDPLCDRMSPEREHIRKRDDPNGP